MLAVSAMSIGHGGSLRLCAHLTSPERIREGISCTQLHRCIEAELQIAFKISVPIMNGLYPAYPGSMDTHSRDWAYLNYNPPTSTWWSKTPIHVRFSLCLVGILIDSLEKYCPSELKWLTSETVSRLNIQMIRFRGIGNRISKMYTIYWKLEEPAIPTTRTPDRWR